MEEYTLVVASRAANHVVAIGAPAAASQIAATLDAASVLLGGHTRLRVDPARGQVVVEADRAEGVVAALEQVARSAQPLTACLWLGRPQQLQLRARVWLPRAATTTEAIAVGPGGASRIRLEAIAGVLRSYLALARTRTPAQWGVIDAVRDARTQSEAAQGLGCSRQTVSKTLSRAHTHAEQDAATALSLLAAGATGPAPLVELPLADRPRPAALPLLAA